MTEELLNLPVPHVPAGGSGVAWLRSQVVRFSEGAEHTRRRALTTSLLEGVDATTLDELAVRLLPGALDEVAVIAPSYQPHEPIMETADAAVERLVARHGRTETTAARIGLLVQAWAATRAFADRLTSGDPTPPVPLTRRATAAGIVEVDLTGHPFGHGAHACPGRELATKIAKNMAFRALHHRDEPLLLPNAWDHATAAALQEAGFPAVATTSFGVSAAHGVPDASGLAKEHTRTLARLLSALPCPVTADVEGGFSADPDEVAEYVASLGVSGINLEDGRGDHLNNPAEQAELITAVKRRTPGVFVNARIDTHWLGVDATISEVLTRAEHYLAAGADGIFVPRLPLPDIATVTAAFDTPLNVLAGEPVERLRDLGVRRISTGSQLFRAARTTTVETAKALLSPGTRSGAA
ncbi:isocitrate lyase/PEP mutase family protein [Lentzea guizhouensis]|nr:isocitrate lyase/phosphoenolpyruvate mutase family protein [Lentzea guizhouensis]